MLGVTALNADTFVTHGVNHLSFWHRAVNPADQRYFLRPAIYPGAGMTFVSTASLPETRMRRATRQIMPPQPKIRNPFADAPKPITVLKTIPEPFELLVAGGEDGRLYLFRDSVLLCVESAHYAAVTCICVSPQNPYHEKCFATPAKSRAYSDRHVVTGSADGRVNWYMLKRKMGGEGVLGMGSFTLELQQSLDMITYGSFDPVVHSVRWRPTQCSQALMQENTEVPPKFKSTKELNAWTKARDARVHKHQMSLWSTLLVGTRASELYEISLYLKGKVG